MMSFVSWLFGLTIIPGATTILIGPADRSRRRNFKTAPGMGCRLPSTFRLALKFRGSWKEFADYAAIKEINEAGGSTPVRGNNRFLGSRLLDDISNRPCS